MAEIVQEKSRGLKFAEQQLLRHGWEQGKGLGRKEDGISEAIKVRVKCDKGGIGHKEGEQFTYHWWDHVFNKASSSLQVESDQNGVKVRKTMEEDEEGMISNKKPTKATLAKAKLYGCFVKSATLLSGQEQPEPKSSQSDDSSSSDDEDQKLDLSSTTKLSDTDLMKACGGRTAHKGARHGLTMSAKLARLEQQEAEFMAKYGKKSQSANASPVCVTPTSQSAAQNPERQEETTEATQSKKMKKKSGDICENGLNGDAVSESANMDTRTKKKKKKERNSHEGSEGITVGFPTEQELSPVENDGADHSQLTKRKHKRREKIADENREEGEATAEDKSSEGTAEASSKQQTDTKRRKKKKRKSKHRREPAEVEEVNDAAISQSELIQKKKDAVIMDEAEVVVESIVKQKRKKCKEDKRSGGDGVNEEALPPKKKKKSKH